MDRGRGGPQGRSGRSEEDKTKSLLLPEIHPWFQPVPWCHQIDNPDYRKHKDLFLILDGSLLQLGWALLTIMNPKGEVHFWYGGWTSRGRNDTQRRCEGCSGRKPPCPVRRKSHLSNTYVIEMMWKVAARRGESNKCINSTDHLQSLLRLSIYIQFENRLYGCRYTGRIVLQTPSHFFLSSSFFFDRWYWRNVILYSFLPSSVMIMRNTTNPPIQNSKCNRYYSIWKADFHRMISDSKIVQHYTNKTAKIASIFFYTAVTIFT